MLQKTVNVGGRDAAFKSSAAIPRMYRIFFKRDIFKELSRLEDAYKDKGKGEDFEIEDLEIFENVAYVMAKPEKGRDGEDFPILAGQEQFDSF